MTEALRIIGLPERPARALIRDGSRLALAELDGDGLVYPLFTPAEVDRLVTFAEHAAAGDPAAVTHPKAILFLATLALGLLTVVDDDTNRRIGG